MSTKKTNSKAVIPFWLVIPAAGTGSRMGADQPKQYQLLAGKPVLQRTLEIFLDVPGLQGVVLALHEKDQQFSLLSVASNDLVQTVVGGAERSDSVLNALRFLSTKTNSNDWVMVHDAARPCVQSVDVEAMLQKLSASSVGGIMAVPVSDTVKKVDIDEMISTTVDRSVLWQAQTPQMFRLGLLREALQQAKQKNIVVTDEASAVESLGHQPQVFLGKRSNIKITHPDDWLIAEAVLKSALSEEDSMSVLRASSLGIGLPRIGHGFDVHRFAEPSENAFITLGGVKIPHTKKLLAHSDGDVLIHALCDALLGAAALGDIGKHFPDTDSAYKNIDSRLLLQKVTVLLKEKKYQIGNVDMTIVAQAPKLLPHVQIMRTNLASDLNIDIERVNVKATTTEKLGFEGREEGISCHAVAMLLSLEDGINS